MLARDTDKPGPLRQQPLLLQLPQRLARLRRRGERLCDVGWDINQLRLLGEDAHVIARACLDAGAAELAADLEGLRMAARALLDGPRVPNHATAEHLAGLIRGLSSKRLADSVGTLDRMTSVLVAGPTREAGYPLLVIPPAQYWQRFADLSPARTMAAAENVAPAPPVSNRGRRTDRRSGDRRARARDDDDLKGTRIEIMRRVGDRLALGTVGPRPGGLLLFVPDPDTLPDGRAGISVAAAAGRLLSSLVGPSEYVAKDAAAQFLLLDPDRDPNLLEAYALNLRDRVAREPFTHRESVHHVVFDVGVCPFATGATDAESMYKTALNAIEGARSMRRHGVFVVSDLQSEFDSGLIERIRFALKTTGLELAFQPIVALHGDDQEQFQTLLRLRDEDDRLYTASEVIPAARQAGLVAALDRWVLESCVSLIGKRGDRGARLRMFITQSPASVRDAQIPALLRALLARHDVDASAVVLELRAAEASGAPAEVRRYAAAMQAIGAQVALSGFDPTTDSYLLDALSPAFVKLDPELLPDGDETSWSGLADLLKALHERGTRVIAPRVENARSAAALWAIGVDFVQGNFVQQPGAELAFDFRESVM